MLSVEYIKVIRQFTENNEGNVLTFEFIDVRSEHFLT